MQWSFLIVHLFWIGFCEFDSPIFAIDSLLKKMQLAIQTNMPYNLEIATCCLEWLKENLPEKMAEFLKLLKGYEKAPWS